MTTPLDHGEIADRALIERYHLGTLAPEEERRFEEHFVACADCQEELEAQRSFLAGLRTVAARDAARAALGAGLLAWAARRRLLAALAAAAVVAVGLALGLLWRQNQRLERQVAAAVLPAEGVASPALEAPLAGLPVVLLGVTRSDGPGGEYAPPTVPAAGAGPYLLAVDAGADPRPTGYTLTLTDAAGEVRFTRSGLLPDDLGVLQLLVPAGYLPPGDYRLAVRGTLPDGGTVEVGSYPFRVR